MFKKIRILKYHFKALYHLKCNKYNKALKCFKKEIQIDLNPIKKRRINYDYLMLEIAEKLYSKNNLIIQLYKVNFDKPNILILNSEINDVGGHTEVALRFTNQFKDDFKITFLLTGLGKTSSNTAPVKSKIIKNNVANFVEFTNEITDEKKIFYIYNLIFQEKITNVIVNIHNQDCVSTAVLGLIKKYTNINVIFWNHSDHYYTLGTEFADIIITRCKNGKALAQNIKDKTNVVDIPFLESSNEICLFPDEEIDREKQKLGIKKDNFITISACSPSKIFSDKKQSYLKWIKKLLIKNPKMVHIIISKINKKENRIMENIIGNDKEISDRLIFLDYTPNFYFYVQLADLYIDSFPQGGALTLVDFIKHGKPTVIKINQEKSIQSFENYLYSDYEYACNTSDEMFEKTCKLINDKEEYHRISHKVREFYLDRYNINNVRKEHLKLIK